MEDSGFFNKVGKNISDNISSISSGLENKKALNDKRNERDKIYKYIGMEAFTLYKEGKMPSSELDVHFEKLKTVDMEISRLEKEIEKQKNKGKINCRNCGTELTSGIQYCPKCGAPVIQNGQMPPYGAGQPGMNYGAPQQGAGGGYDPYTSGIPEPSATSEPFAAGPSGQVQSGTTTGYGAAEPFMAGPSGTVNSYNPDGAIPKVNEMNTSGSYPPKSYDQGVPQSGFQPTPQSGYQPTPQPGFQPTPQPGYQSTPQSGYQSTPQPGYQPTPQSGVQPTPESGFQPTPQPGYQSAPQPEPQGKVCVCGAIIPPGNTLCMQCGRRADVV